MATDSGDRPADTMRERGETSRAKLWVLLEAPRWVVVALLLAVVAGSLVVAGAYFPDAAPLLAGGDPVETLFQALVGATITGVTLVLTLNQLVLSQELGAMGDQRERMEGAMAFRRDAEDLVEESVAPTDPAAFLRALVEASHERAGSLREAVDDGDEDLRDAVALLADAVEDNAEEVSDQLDGAHFGTFAVVSAALNFNYSWKLYTARRIRAEYDDALTEAAAGELDDLVDLLELYGPAREHFKTLYFQWELIELSRTVLVTSIPSLVVAAAMVVYFDPADATGTVLGVSRPVLVVAGAAAVALLPFAVLLAYVLRIATVTKRTLSIGTFTLRRTGRQEESGVE